MVSTDFYTFPIHLIFVRLRLSETQTASLQNMHGKSPVSYSLRLYWSEHEMRLFE